eukprot:9408028-Ditylum_brightwellii.AAC.1
MHAPTYLSKILKNHGWECCPKDEEKIIEPIHPNSIKELELSTGPESEAENIGYAVTELSKLSTSPVQCHYKAVNHAFCPLSAPPICPHKQY